MQSVLEKGEQSPLHKPYKDEVKAETSLSLPNQNREGECRDSKEFPKYSSFLYGDQFCNEELNRISQGTQKRHSAEAFDEMMDATDLFKKSKSSAAPQSVDDGSASTCSEEDKDFTIYAAPSRKSFSPQMTSTTSTTMSIPREVSFASQFFGYPNVPFLKSTQSKGRLDFSQHHQHSHHLPLSLRGDLSTPNFFNNLKPPGILPHAHEEENDGDDSNGGVGSELLVAAYNNFVRKLVDETLDRTITFCEQPRNAISALERICSKAWPQLEAKRHRNRIRAYLKACRRNSKKNRGQINMKEPPMNGLSVEARQMVTTALNLVMKDIEQLRQDLKRDNSPSVFTAKNGTLPPNLRRPEPFSSSSRGPIPRSGGSAAQTTSPLYSTTKSSKCTEDHLTSIKTSSFQNLVPPVPPLLHSSTGGAFPPPTGLDPEYVSALMRFLPSNLPFGADFEASYRSAAMQAAMLMNGAFRCTEDDSISKKAKLDCKIGKRELGHSATSITMQPPPAAHFAVAKYSPTLNEAASMLLDVRPLSQEDIAYFQHYQEIMHEALNYVRGVSQMLMKKVEILEGHFRLRSSSSGTTPLNYVNN